MQHAPGKRWTLAGALAAALVVVALGIGARGVAAQDSAAVSIVDFAFQPNSSMVVAGGTVTWTNTGQAPHTVTADDGSFDSGTLSPGATFSQTFPTAGTFTYHCNIHPQMTATVIVGDAGGSGSDAQAPAADQGGKQAGEAKANKVPAVGVGTMARAGGESGLALLAGMMAAVLGTAAMVAYRRA